MKDHPSISILIPTFNQELGYLKECVDSALAQTFTDIEVVVSNNHSTNGTQALLQEYCDERLVVVFPETFLSMNENFAFCAKYARGRYISFLSSDDVLLPDAMAKLFGFLEENPSIAFACGNIYHSRTLPAKGNRTAAMLRPRGAPTIVLDRKEAHAFFFPWKIHCTWMAGDLIRRDAYCSTGGFGNCDLLTTGDVWLTRSLLEVGGFGCLSEPLALFRSRSIFKPEIDGDRQLLDYTDHLCWLAEGSERQATGTKRRRQQLSLIYRLGSVPGPSQTALSAARTSFARLERTDLVVLIDWFRSNGSLARIISRFVHPFNIGRKMEKILVAHIKRGLKW